MINISDRLFLCYAWEDSATIQNIVKEFDYELNSNLYSDSLSKYKGVIDDSVFTLIEESEIIIVFITESAKNSEYVKQSITRASNLNKNIIPVELEKQSMFSSTPDEFKFRTKTYSYDDPESKVQLFAQLKATLGLVLESGDDFGTLVHIVTDRSAKVKRYGKELGIVEAGVDFKIRLAKGCHLLVFEDIEEPSLTYSTSRTIESNEGEDYIEIPLNQLLRTKQEKEEKARREQEIKRKFEDEQYHKNLQLQQQERELAVKRREQELKRIEEEEKRKEEEDKRKEEVRKQRIESAKKIASNTADTVVDAADSAVGCVFNVIKIILFIGFIVFIFSLT